MVDNGAAGRAYPDKTRMRQKMTDRQRIEELEKDQTLTEIMVDDVVGKLQRLRACMAKKQKKLRQRFEDEETTEESMETV